MKKVFLSVALTLIFAGYVAYQRVNGFGSGLPSDVPTPAPETPTTPVPSPSPSAYRDGSYTGSSVDAYYGNVQVSVVISGGKITTIKFLDYPRDRDNSLEISNYAMPILTREAIAAQSASVDAVSGATSTSDGFKQSLESALAQAAN